MIITPSHFVLSFLLCSHSASFTLCYAAVAAASTIITIFSPQSMCHWWEKETFFLVTMREKLRRNFGEFMFLSRAVCYLLFITAGTVDMERGKIFNIEQWNYLNWIIFRLALGSLISRKKRKKRKSFSFHF